LLQKKHEVAESYQAYGTPSAVLIRPDGTIGSPLAQGADAIRSLVQALNSAKPAELAQFRLAVPSANSQKGRSGLVGTHAAARMGEPAPRTEFRDLNDKRVTLADFHGKRTLLLFWNPQCGFCQQMLADLQAWDSDPPTGAPQLAVISTGSAQENRSMNLRSPVLLDRNFGAGPAFGATGTPMAVLLDAEGRIASEVAAGAQAVFALANGARFRGEHKLPYEVDLTNT
jgi:peroxiredoxin